MSVSLRLDLRQSQSLVMTPQLQQAIKLLQLPNLELTTYVQGELEQNPFLERAESADDNPNGDGSEPPPEPTAAEGPEFTGRLEMAAAEAPGGAPGSPDDGWAGAQRDDPHRALGLESFTSMGRGGTLDFADDGGDVAARLSQPKTLREHLIEQLQLDLPPGSDRLIAMHLVDLVDDAGYLTEPIDRVAERLGCPIDEVVAVLERLQQFDPPGVFARSLGECLALQLREANRLDPAMATLLQNLDLVARAQVTALATMCRVSAEDVIDMIAEIKALDPKPGVDFLPEPVTTVVPDIMVSPAPGGGWRVELNSATLPRVLVNRTYYTELCRQATDRPARSYLSERFQAANWLSKALDQRARTLLKVAEAVMERQMGFLQHGVQRLRPLLLRDIAAVTDLHESTVSRATAEKHVTTPRGNYPFRYFFSNALPGVADGASHSAEAIRQQIKAMIEREDARRPLSDDQIVEVLRDDGVAIARRTVAKYRESLSIPSSVQRRRAKALRLA